MTDHTELALLIDRLRRHLDTEMHRLVPSIDTKGVGPLGSVVLMALEQIEPAPIQNLVAHLARDKSQITRAVKTLEEKGMIQRDGSAQDRRVQVVQLTTEGRKYVSAQKKLMDRIMSSLLAPLSEQDRSHLSALLHRLALTTPR